MAPFLLRNIIMPFLSKAQRGYLYAKHPEVAKEFAEKTSAEQEKTLPEHVKPKEEPK